MGGGEFLEAALVERHQLGLIPEALASDILMDQRWF